MRTTSSSGLESRAPRAQTRPSPSISHAELIEATYRRSRYYVYRVIEVDSATPTITQWSDPLALIKQGKGRLLLAKAQMALTLEEEPAAPVTGETDWEIDPDTSARPEHRSG